MSGKIHTFYEITCGKCEDETEHPPGQSKNHAAKILRDGGWKKTKEHGWVCPVCNGIEEKRQ